MNPFRQAPNFVDLLNSQVPEEFGSSQVPLFRTQWTEESGFSEDTPEDTPAGRKERNTWSPTDDLLLISAWLNTSKDPLVGNEQKSVAFWQRIADYIKASPKAAGGVIREPNHCKNRWQKINDIVNKFCGSFEAASRERASGQNNGDVLKRAYEIFYNNHCKRFNLEHAWRQLRFDQKWCELSTAKANGGSKKRKCEDGASSATSLLDDEAQKRPPGVKAAKGRGKKRVDEGKDVSELQIIREIKDKDHAMKATLANKRLLDSLIAKREPLSQSELALKEKLISDMLAN